MTKFIYYLYENFKVQMLVAKIWPTAKIEEIVYLMEWYSTKLRPFMWEFYGIMTAASEAGLTKERDTSNRDQENFSKLQQIHEEYLTRFKFMCTQIEQKFFTGQNTFLFGEKATVVDYVFYQELLSAMILSGQGT